jgi:hypothetical protein
MSQPHVGRQFLRTGTLVPRGVTLQTALGWRCYTDLSKYR